MSEINNSGNTSLRINTLEVRGNPVVLSALSGEASLDEVKKSIKGGPPVIAVSLSRPTYDDLLREGYNVIIDIGSPRQLSITEITTIAEEIAIIIDRVRRVLPSQKIFLVLSCPVTAAFMIGTLLDRHASYELLHWENGRYKKLPAFDDKRFKEMIADPSFTKK